MSFTKEAPSRDDGSSLARIMPELAKPLNDGSPGRFSLVRRWDVTLHHEETFGPYASVEEVTEDLRRAESTNNFRDIGGTVGIYIGMFGALGGAAHFFNTGEATGPLLAFAGMSASGFGMKLVNKAIDMRKSLSAYREYLSKNPIQFPDLGPVSLLKK